MEIMRRLFAEEEGQGLVEYVMIVAVVVAIGIAVTTTDVGATIGAKIKEVIGKTPTSTTTVK